ncbi:MAG: hypothetical protein AB7U98_07630 [Candidatus Nitrosocosmicus sp.]|uniref:hypothetical protein n=1 Tax=Candidatus Nitrosocosmicus sp. FF01 TaxID=3397670 RepID=UPI002A7287C0|nr:hypothetical protein [Candidatus Nitrosocosmicus sp.]GKS62050.1 hypothetical protein YTPLAS21_15080 [Candidatus Nitrosocosmicus sp.]
MNTDKESNIPASSASKSVEYILLESIGNELWEIDYQNGIALNVTEIINPETTGNIIRYSGKIEDFLSNERGLRNLHFHESVNFPMRVHFDN